MEINKEEVDSSFRRSRASYNDNARVQKMIVDRDGSHDLVIREACAGENIGDRLWYGVVDVTVATNLSER